MEAATALGTAAVTAAGDGQCSDSCPAWLDSATSCATDVSDVAATLACACSESFLSGMTACAACIGEDAPAQADSASDFLFVLAPLVDGSLTCSPSSSTRQLSARLARRPPRPCRTRCRPARAPPRLLRPPSRAPRLEHRVEREQRRELGVVGHQLGGEPGERVCLFERPGGQCVGRLGRCGQEALRRRRCLCRRGRRCDARLSVSAYEYEKDLGARAKLARSSRASSPTRRPPPSFLSCPSRLPCVVPVVCSACSVFFHSLALVAQAKVRAESQRGREALAAREWT